MRPGTLHDLPGVYRVCRLTGAGGADASALHADPDLLGHVWAGPYLVFPDAVTRVIHDEHGVAGYCLAVPDTAAFERWVERGLAAPAARAAPGSAAARPRPTPRSSSACTTPPPRMPACSPRTRRTCTSTSCPGCRARAGDDASWRTVLEELARAGAPGVHLGVDVDNVGAQAFYERIGFTELAGPPGARFYGADLGSRS